MDEASNNVAVASGTNGSNISTGLISNGLITGGLVAPVYPNVCPGCGRCRDCGHPYTAPYVAPYAPYAPGVTPYWGPPNTGIITCGGTAQAATQGTAFINSQTNAAQ